MPRFPYGRFPWLFEYRSDDHDYTEKTFLGETGRFNGEDIIDIIVRQPACPRFIARHLYNFFVADEPQVPAWNIEEPRDPEAIRTLSDALVESGFEIRPVLRILFNSDFFKEAAYKKMKSPSRSSLGLSSSPRTCRAPTRGWSRCPSSRATWDRTSWTRPASKAGTPVRSGSTAARW